MRREIFFFFLLFLSFSVSPSTAQSNPPDQFFLQHLDNRNGLSNSAINHIFQDSDDIIWVATWDGLNMFDGTSFHVFNYSKENDFKGIGSNVIQNITEDKHKNIWISTIEGISRYEKYTGKFYNYFYSQNQKSPVSEQEYELAIDKKGTVFCLTQKYGLTYYDTLADTFRRSALPPTSFQRSSKISKLIFDESNRLWLLNNKGGLEVYSRIGNLNFKLLNTFSQKTGVQNFFFTNNQIFFTTKDFRLFNIDNQTLAETPVLQMKHGITSMIFYKDHYLLAWLTMGYGVFDRNFKPASFLNEEVRQMQNIKVTSWALGSEQILWYGTDGNGIIKIYPRTKFFGTITTSDNGMPYNKSVRAFCEENGNLWVGTKGSGIINIQNFRSTGQKSLNKQNFTAPGKLDNNSVFALKKGIDDLIYIGTDGKGIGVYDLKSKKFNKWVNIQGFDRYPEFGSVYAILQDIDQSLWLGTSGYGLIHLKIIRDRSGNLSLAFLERFKFNNNNTGPGNDIIYALAKGNENYLWVACRYGGLSLLNKQTRKFKTFKAFTYEGSLSNNDVLSLYKDKKNRIWVGTSYGLNWIDQKDASLDKPSFKKLTTVNGLPNNTIHAIEEDGMGNIWVSTNKGLAKVQPSNLEISRYQQIDGLQSNEFCDGAVWKDSSGFLFFGGTYGFNYFLPKNIMGNTLRPNLLVSGIQLGGDQANEVSMVVLKPDVNSSLAYSLTRKENYFEMQLKAMSFVNAEKCEYAYYLEGNDKIWHYSGTAGKISYSNIPPGKYTLKVKWSNGEGVWTKEVNVFNLEVKSYFWLTIPAFLLYFIFLSVAGYVAYTYRKNKLEIKHQLATEHLLRKKEEDLHQQQIGFFTNITHELQTPLTLIMGSTERSLEKTTRDQSERPYFLSLIHQQASRLTYLVQQLLEFRKGEAGFIKNQFSYLNVSELLYKLSELFIPLSEQSEMVYTRKIKPDIVAWIDKDKLEKIMFNLLSNAFKHSVNNEQVVITVHEHKFDKVLEIIVANSGCEIPADQLDRLFDKFYGSGSIGYEKFSTGIGLAFTRQLVLLLNGTIEVTSENNWITFKVVIPLPVIEISPDTSQLLTTNPSSFLYKSMTSYHRTPAPSAVENNKQAIIEDLQLNRRKSILLVEDESAIRYLLKDILKDHYTIYEAEDGKQALEFVLKVIPDLIISDVMMPGLNGLELCNRIKNAPATCHIPFIILSAKGSIENRTEGYEVGADAYIAKPFHTAHLLVRVRKLLEYRERLKAFINNDSQIDFIIESDLVDGDKQFLSKLLAVIEKNLDEPELNAAKLEHELAMSKMQLYRKLKIMTNMTPGEFIKHIRLKHAAHLLSSTNLTVSEIFYRTGFNNQSYFYREFKKRYEVAPNEYRSQQHVQV